MVSEAVKKLANEARDKGMWLFDESGKRWFEPDEFERLFIYTKMEDTKLATYKLMHPIEGIRAGFKKLQDLHTYLQHFQERVFNYYKK